MEAEAETDVEISFTVNVMLNGVATGNYLKTFTIPTEVVSL